MMNSLIFLFFIECQCLKIIKIKHLYLQIVRKIKLPLFFR